MLSTPLGSTRFGDAIHTIWSIYEEDSAGFSAVPDSRHRVANYQGRVPVTESTLF
jgi:hypothetical protein